ncbi:unnamed protein product, partial [Brassica rapa subsp. narinosa]
VKSGYWATTHDLREGDAIIPSMGSFDLKMECWKINIIPKIKNFLWKLLSGALATYTQLCSRGIRVSPICQRCCVEEETINHVLFECPHAIAIWRISHLPIGNMLTRDLEENIKLMMRFMVDNKEDTRIGLLPFWIIWFVWKSRNEYLFNKRNQQPIEDLRRAWDSNEEWHQNVIFQSARDPPQRFKCSQWIPPPTGWLKCNFDCSFKRDSEFTGVGWIVRDDKGYFIAAGSAKISGLRSSLDGEAHAFLYALQNIWIKGWRQVWFEGDNMELTKIINQSAWSMELGNILTDIRYWMSLLPECSLDQINRERNQAADALAKKAKQGNNLSVFYITPPAWLIIFLYEP